MCVEDARQARLTDFARENRMCIQVLVMKPRLLLAGLAIWLVATVILRYAGHRILAARDWPHVIALFTISFALAACIVRAVCLRARLAAAEWPGAAASLLLPTLALDPFSSAFFHSVFPNMDPESAGVFGGWMLMCCAGGFAGALVHSRAAIPQRRA